MTRALLIIAAFSLVTPFVFAQQLPPPQNPAGNEAEPQPQAPAIIPPQNVQLPPQPQQPPAPPQGVPAAKRTPEQRRQFYAARRKATQDRKQARIDRMNQFLAARAVEEQKLYEDWHERYLADTPVRVEYYRALTAAYQSPPALSYYTPYYYASAPAVILPVVYAPVYYAPVVATPAYGPYTPYSGIVFSWGW